MNMITQQAEVLCEKTFARFAPRSKYIAGSDSRMRQLALHRTSASHLLLEPG
jgi:hypothetical protein